MDDISEIARIGLFAGHDDEIPFLGVNDFHIVYCKTIVECDGQNRAQRSVIKGSSYLYVRDLHICTVLSFVAAYRYCLRYFVFYTERQLGFGKVDSV